MDKFIQPVLTAIAISLILWQGHSTQENGKAIARLEVQVAYLTKQIDNMTKERFANLTKE